MAKQACKDIVLDYHDSLLRVSDVELLKTPSWLNDTIIGFYFEYLDKKFNTSQKKEILFVSPAVTQLCKFSLSQRTNFNLFLKPLGAKDCSFILFPLNNCQEMEIAGGTHWSLLVYSKPENTYYHYDSAGSSNSSIAVTFAKDLFPCLCDKNKDFNFVDVNCAQQENGYDCGVFVLCFADTISQHALQNYKLSDCTCIDVSQSVKTKRSELLKLIELLKIKYGK